ncbi:glycerol-3-phosphate dehydrogenase subunit GlpB [Actinomyces trachealis]|uniref:glycerol-3-phosphate dehydrogenase subunit GlpB n=1 Tax=Actinomyces trachealis TaxID=2763540 RepID=UPI0018C4DA2B|nr:glycerol-3-phosphate dehydrogenase subunit GlpB [Actinomyces trachealis]
MSSDVVVIGAGIAGYVTALRLRRAGASVTLVTKGVGGLPLSTGNLDVLGRLGGVAGPAGPGAGATEAERWERRAVTHPYTTINEESLLPEGHPYLVIGAKHTAAGVAGMCDLAGPELLTARTDDDGAGTNPHGPANFWLPTAIGAIRPSLVLQPSMAASVLRDGGRYLVVGLARLKDLTAELVAGNLNRSELPSGGRVEARALTIDFEAHPGEADTNAVGHARALDSAVGREQLLRLLAGQVRPGETVLLPAVLGLEQAGVYRELAERLGAPVGEIPLVPPSVPGLRLEHRLERLAVAERVRIVMGGRVVDSRSEHGRLVSVTSAAAGRPREHRAAAFVLAAGGFESGALAMDSYGIVTETVLGLPLAGVGPDGAENLRRLIHRDYWGMPQGVFRVGVAVDKQMRPLGADGEPVLEGLHAAGGVLAGAVRWSEMSGEGIALGSAHAAAEAVLAALGQAPTDSNNELKEKH